jgi:dihydrolipoamide dehydrogenase
MEEVSTTVLVIGGGPGGYVAAIRAGQLGLPTVLVEKGPLGGTCLNIGCIPSKALIHVAESFHHAASGAGSAFGLTQDAPRIDFAQTLAWKNAIVSRLTGGVGGLLRKAKVQVVAGTATIEDGKTVVVDGPSGRTRLRCAHLVIATGSEPSTLPSLPFGGPVIGSTEALSLAEIPASLAVVGAGYIGVELGTAFAKLGSKVTLVEAAARILPTWDAELTRPVARRLQALGVDVVTDCFADGLSADGRQLLLRRKGIAETPPVTADRVLVAVGRRPVTHGFGLEGLDLAMDGPFVRVDDRCATSMRNVWAIGDVTGEPMLAHRAMAQGEALAEVIAGHRRTFDPAAIPAICFCDPEIVAVGLSPDAARDGGEDVSVGTFPFAANGRAMTQGDDGGFVRVVARASDHVVLGIQAVGAQVSELAAAFTLAIEMGARAEDIAATIHAHPSRGEALQEASLASLGRAIHI